MQLRRILSSVVRTFCSSAVGRKGVLFEKIFRQKACYSVWSEEVAYFIKNVFDGDDSFGGREEGCAFE